MSDPAHDKPAPDPSEAAESGSSPTASAAADREAAERAAEQAAAQAARVRGQTREQKWIVIGLAVIAACYLIAQTRALLLPIVLAILFNFLLTPLTRFGRRFHIPEPLSAGIIILLFAAVVGGSIYGLSFPAVEWLAAAPENLQTVREKFSVVGGASGRITELLDRIEKLTGMSGASTQAVAVREQGPGLGGMILAQGQAFLKGAFFTLVLTFFLLASGDAFTLKMVHLMPQMHKKEQALRIMRRTQRGITRYLVNITLINLALGVATAAVMWLIGLENPMLWGAVAALFNYVPYLGPLAVIGLLAFVGLLSFDNVVYAMLPPAAFGALNLCEAYLLTPTILGRHLSLHPVAIIASLLLWGYLWGVAGALLAVPMLVIVKIISENVETLAPVSEMLGHEQKAARVQPHE